MFRCPVIRIISDAAIFVSDDGITLHNPFDSTFAIYYVFLSCGWYIFNRYLAVVYNFAFIRFGGKAHLFNLIIDCLHLA